MMQQYANAHTEQSEPKQYPNIVVIMEESFWDSRQLDPKLPKDLSPIFNKNQMTQLLSPSFGGGTANVEFEVLTSLNTKFFPNELLYVSKLKNRFMRCHFI